jgi:hypothetical protein
VSLPYRVFDAHIHVQPHELLHPRAAAAIHAGRADLSLVERVMSSPDALLKLMDEEGVERAALIKATATAWCPWAASTRATPKTSRGR